jgi:hypothetical protein
MEHRQDDAPPWANTTADSGESADPQEADDGTPPNVIIAVSLDELDGLAGDLLV